MIEEAGLPTRYLVQSCIGAGGIGIVYRAHDTQLDQIVAVKVLGDVAPAAWGSLADEFRILSHLSHPSLVKVLDFGLCGNSAPFFSMEYIDGPDLKGYLVEPGALAGIATLLTDILSALHYLQTCGIVHGDIKPENILIRYGEAVRPVLADFGLSAFAGARADVLSGTPRFLAPEVLAERRYSVRSDLYALGHTLIESITGQETPPAPKIDADYLARAGNLLEDHLRQTTVGHSSDLAHIITDLAHPLEEQRLETPATALKRLRALDLAQGPASLFSEEAHIERTAEETAIRDFLLSETSKGGILLLEGISGCGKKSLMQRAAGIAQLHGDLVINTLPARRLSVDTFIDLVASNLPAAAGAELLSSHRDIVSRLSAARKQEDLVNVGVIHDNIARTLHALSQERPVLILIADLERHDEDLVHLVGQLVHESGLYNSRIKFIISRNTDAETSPDRALRQEKVLSEMDARKLEIRGFDFEQYLHYFQTLFQDPVFSPEEHNILFAWTRGIPQVIVDHLKFLLGTGIITFRGNTYHVDRSRYSVGDADGMDQTTTVFFSDLDQGTLDLLRLLALYNSPLSPDDLEHLLGKDPTNMIDAGLRRGLLERTGVMVQLASPAYSVSLSDAMSKDDRRKINIRIADHLAARGGDDRLCAARHYIAAGVAGLAYEHGMAAVEQLQINHQHFTCNALLKDLASLLCVSNDLTAMLNVQERLCESNVTLGLVDEALDGYKQILKESKDPLQQARCTFRIGRIYASIIGDKAAAREHYLKALPLLKEKQSPALESNTYLYLGTLDNNMDYLKRAAKLARNVETHTYIKSLSLISYAHLVSGDFDAVSKIEEEFDRYMGSSDLSILKDVYDAKSIIRFYTGRYDEAEDCLSKAIAITGKTCDQMETIRFSSSLSGNYYIRGNYFKQIDMLCNNLFLVKQYKAYHKLLYILSNLSLGYICLALYRNAIEHIREGASYIADNLITRIPYFFYSVASNIYCELGADYDNDYSKCIEGLERVAKESNISIALGHACMYRGNKTSQMLDFLTALEHYREAANIFESTNTRDDNVEALLRSAECLIESGDRDEAERLFRRAEEIFEAIGCQYLAPLYWYVRGKLEASAEAGSADSLLTALNISTKQGTREMTWQIQRALAEYHLRSGNLHEASNYYRAAVATLKQITEPFQDERMVRSYLDVPLRHRLFEEIHALRERL